ncbi:hypothetical protein HYV10_04420, partial [Candidatus Dependentiae bacterium]|nr:hypothetical protein [Candidatus Dependentiae bacterium]
MKKLFLKFSQNRYQIIQLDEEQTMEIIGLYIDKESKEFKPIPVLCRYIFQNNVLDVLFLALQPILGIDIETDGMPKSNEIFMWARFSIKKQEYKEFPAMEESIAYDDRYEEYYDKRWEEAPKVKIFIDDWQNLQQQWKQIKKELPQYVIFTLDDSGPIDKIE